MTSNRSNARNRILSFPAHEVNFVTKRSSTRAVITELVTIDADHLPIIFRMQRWNVQSVPVWLKISHSQTSTARVSNVMNAVNTIFRELRISAFWSLTLTVGKKRYVRQNNLPVADIARVLTLVVFNDNWIVERRPKEISYSTSDNEILRTI